MLQSAILRINAANYQVFHKLPLLIVITFLPLFISCAPRLPILRVWRPWLRTIDSPTRIKIGSSIKTEVTGSTKPLLGNEGLMQNEIAEMMRFLLERRGYVAAIDSADYYLHIEYETKDHDEIDYSSIYYASGENYLGSLSTTTSGLGVTIANAIAAFSAKSTTIVGQRISSSISYIHSISIEIYNNGRNCIWKGESTWNSINPDILGEIRVALQLLMSDLPFNPEFIPEVPKIRDDHVINYYMLNVEDYWFSCPALPYRITFPESYKQAWTGKPFENKMPYESPTAFFRRSIDKENRGACAAFVDLVRTAEYALPEGKGDWQNPLNALLWTKVTLGGRYRIGPEGQPVNILVTLSGEYYGYLVKKCQIVDDSEYTIFKRKLSDWQMSLQQYYDIFEK